MAREQDQEVSTKSRSLIQPASASEERFDQLTLAVAANHPSRGQVLKALCAVLFLSLPMGALWADLASGKKRHCHKKGHCHRGGGHHQPSGGGHHQPGATGHPLPGPPPQCNDGIDNDNDGAIDMQDPGCRTGDTEYSNQTTTASPSASPSPTAPAGAE